MSLFERLTSLFAPDECLACRREGSLLCDRCVASLPPLPGVCFGCRATVGGVVCACCLQKSGCLAVSAAVGYQGLAKQLVASLKFIGNQSAAKIMAERMLLGGELPADALVTHLPATTAHIRERGYDQAALLAQLIARRIGARHTALLSRLGKQHQLGADRAQRLAQLQPALRVRRAAVLRDRHIVLVDDVLTTGASISVASAKLLEAGAASVTVLVFAQAGFAPKIKKTSAG